VISLTQISVHSLETSRDVFSS